MSLNDFNLFLTTIGGVIGRAWSCLQELEIAGAGLGTWFLGLFLAGVIVRIFYKFTTGSEAPRPATRRGSGEGR